MNGGTTQRSTMAVALHRRFHYLSGLLLRILVALVVACLVIMAFFATSVISR
jgi:hypothetical protein